MTCGVSINGQPLVVAAPDCMFCMQNASSEGQAVKRKNLSEHIKVIIHTHNIITNWKYLFMTTAMHVRNVLEMCQEYVICKEYVKNLSGMC